MQTIFISKHWYDSFLIVSKTILLNYTGIKYMLRKMRMECSLSILKIPAILFYYPRKTFCSVIVYQKRKKSTYFFMQENYKFYQSRFIESLRFLYRLQFPKKFFQSIGIILLKGHWICIESHKTETVFNFLSKFWTITTRKYLCIV